MIPGWSRGSVIEHLPLQRGRPQDRANFRPTPFEVFGSDHQKVQRNRPVRERHIDFRRLLAFRSLDRHHNKQIDIAVRTCITARMRTEEDDLVRAKLGSNPPHHFVDGVLNLFPVPSAVCHRPPYAGEITVFRVVPSPSHG